MDISGISAARSDISEMISKIREITNKSSALSEIKSPDESSSFGRVMEVAKNSLGSVNNLQVESEAVKNAYITGDKAVSLSQVVVAAQKSKLAFEGLIAVRNKILEAYKEIMNMPI